MTSGPELQIIEARAEIVGDGMPIHRALPSRLRRMVGPWCFLDHIGPATLDQSGPLHVGPHPHTGLQTVTWLIEGEIFHRDSLGTEQLIRPGQLNVMTSGRAISHSEESPNPASPNMHGVQFWIALPDASRHVEPMFDHYAQLPIVDRGGFHFTVIEGEALGERSPARSFWPTLGLDVVTAGGAALDLPLREDFEYAAFMLTGSAEVGGETLAPNALVYLGSGRNVLALRSEKPSRFMLIGGKPFESPILMWWNFVAREKAEILKSVREWNAGEGGFGEVHGYAYGQRLSAPVPPWIEHEPQ